MNGDQRQERQERWRQKEKKVKVSVSCKGREERDQNVVKSSVRNDRGKDDWFELSGQNQR